MIVKGNPTLLGSGPARNCVIIAGQSNANGFNNSTSLIPSNIQGEFSSIKVYRPDNSFVFLNNSVNSSFQIPNTNGSWACQYPLMVDIYNQIGSDMYYIQYALGSTSLAANWLPSSGSRYIELKNCIGNFKTGTNAQVNFKCVVWVQGEQDANSLSTANAYETNLTNFVSAIRTTTGTTTPFVIVQLNNNSTLTYKNTIRTAQQNVCTNVTACYLVDVDSCEMQADNIHYTAAGYVQMAQNILTVMNNNSLLN